MDSYGVKLIAAERQRQVEEEGWTPEHDAQHANGELATVGGIYALRPVPNFDWSSFWPQPWHGSWWKPCPNDRIRELAKAGALIAAEIDRLQAKKEADRDPPAL